MQHKLTKRFLKTLAFALTPLVAAATFVNAAEDAAAVPAASSPSSPASTPAPKPARASTELAPSTGATDPADETVRLDAVSVEATGVERTVLPTRPSTSLYGFEEILRDTPRSVYQISKAQLDSDNIRNFTDFARYSPSIRRGTTTTYSVANIRQGTADTARNGIILFNPALRPFDNNAWESVDIVAGVPSVIQGNTSRTAGYVNYITKKPYFDGTHTTVTAQWGRLGLGSAGTTYGQYSVQLDHSQVLIKDVLAARISVQRAEADQYWKSSDADFKDAYAAITYKPFKNLTIEANFTYLNSIGQMPWGINRITQDLINNWNYVSGQYSPRIGWHGTNYTVGPDHNTYLLNNGNPAGFTVGNEPWSQSDPGALNGYVLHDSDKRTVRVNGNEVLESKIPGLNNRAFEYIGQIVSTLKLNEHFTLRNNTTYQYIDNSNHNLELHYSEHPNRLVETRFEFITDHEFKIAGLPIRHQSNSGLSYRYLLNGCDSAVGDGYQYPITYGDVTNPAGTGASVLLSSPAYTMNPADSAGVQPRSPTDLNGVLQTGYGYLLWTPTFAEGGGYRGLAVPGSPSAGDRRWNYMQTTSLFTEHKIDIGDSVTWRVAGRFSYIDDYIRTNGITKRLVNQGYYPGTNLNDSAHDTNGDFNTSLIYKANKWLNLYVTYDYNTSNQDCGCCQTQGFTGNNQLNDYYFSVESQLIELGAKLEIIPNKLFANVAWFHQTRQVPSINYFTGAFEPYDNIYEGAEFAITYQPTTQFSVGANYSYIHVTDERSGARFIGSPLHTANLWASYQFANGFGVKGNAWITSPWKVSNTVNVPTQFSLDAGVFYVWNGLRVDVEVMNVTDQKNWGPSSGLGGNSYGYLLPLERFGLQAKITYTF